MTTILLRRGQPKSPLHSPTGLHRRPKFLRPPQDLIVKEGDLARFKTSLLWVKGESDVRWEKDKKVLGPPFLDTRIRLERREDIWILEISEVVAADAGIYGIRVGNENGEAYRTVRLNVIGRRRSAPLTSKRQVQPVRSISTTEDPQIMKRAICCNSAGAIIDGKGQSPSEPEINCQKSMRANELILENTSRRPANLFLTAPKIVQPLADLTCLEGEGTEFVATIQGVEEVVWMRNDLLIADSPYFKYNYQNAGNFTSTLKLVIERVSSKDSGKYSCQARNCSGQSTTSAILSVNEAAPPLAKKKVTSRSSSKSECEILTHRGKRRNSASGVVISSIRTLLSSVSSNSELVDKDRKSMSQEAAAKLTSYKKSSGQSSAKGHEAKTFNNVKSVVQVHTEKAEIQNLDEKELQMLKTEGNDLTPVSNEVIAGIRPSLDATSPITSKVSVVDPRHDSGIIAGIDSEEGEQTKRSENINGCIAKAVLQFRGDSVSRDDQSKRSPSVLGPTYLIALKEEQVHIRIKYNGTPQPSIEWTKGGKICGDVIQNSELSSVLIENANYDDSGFYIAKISNEHGTYFHKCFLAVQGPPEPPSSPPTAYYNELTSSISISWSGSPYDGGSIITSYIIQASVDEADWSTLSTVTWLTFTLQSPIPGSSYRFRVQCTNMYGDSPPTNCSCSVHIPRKSEELQDNQPQNDELDEQLKTLAEADVQVRRGSLHEFYIKGEELGKGRFGIVFKATHRETGIDFAGKIVRCIKSADKVKVRQEVEIMKILRHPKLLQVMDALENDKEICIVTEKINGGELFERVVADDFTLTEFDCIGFMRQICDGVRFMHQKNVIHLDLKPENILCLTRTTYTIKIIDFGLSQMYDQTTPLRVLFGTPEFVAPEIINYEPISPASDLWALGVITYVLLSGLSPFMGESDSETFSNITQGLFDFEDEAFDTISEDAKDFISKLLIRRQEKRMSASECLSHKWLAYPEPNKNVIIPTDKLKRFIIRRKWQKTGNALRALGRMANLSRKSTEFGSISYRKSDDSGTENSPRLRECASLDEESEQERSLGERKRQLFQRQPRVDSSIF